MSGILGEIRMFAGNFAPQGWAFCHGQEVPIDGNQALFGLLGTAFGGDGRAKFKLPDLRSRVPVCVGQGPGLSEIGWGQTGGDEGARLPDTSILLVLEGSVAPKDAGKGVAVTAATVAPGGGEIGTMPPFVGLNYIICVSGDFPSRY